MSSTSRQFDPYDFESLTVSTSALALTAAVYNTSPIGPRQAIISVETNPLRYRVDGVDPTAAIGHLVTAGSEVEVNGLEAVRAIRLIRSGAADSTIMVTYYQ